MGDLLRQGSRWLEQMRVTHCSSPVTYRRGGTTLIVNATSGRTQYEVADDVGLRVGAEVMDFLVMADELLPTLGNPQAGDQIVADGALFELMNLAGQGCWRWSDPYRTTMRIHTKEIGHE